MFRLSIDFGSPLPIYRQLIYLIKLEILSRRLNNGDQLPPIRELAKTLKLNPNTVAKAYNELELRGMVNTQVGFGTFIADKKIIISEIEKKKKVDKYCADFLIKLKELGVEKHEIIKILKNFHLEVEE